MQKFSVKKERIDGLYLIFPFIMEDKRGLFIKDYSLDYFKAEGIEYNIEEVFYAYSKKGVIRGIHFQKVKQQPKLVRCVKGKIFDVVVDLRQNSPTFKQWNGYYLDDENMHELLIPEGCGHGYLVLEEAIVSYKCAERFYEEYDDGIIWNDKDLYIEWPLDLVNEVILSEKDESLQSFKEFCTGLKRD